MIELMLLMSILQNVSSSHDFILYHYDCTQFSNELRKQLKVNNQSSWCAFGTFDGQLHDWVVINDTKQGLINLEATRGIIIDNETYSQHYKPFVYIKDRGWCP